MYMVLGLVPVAFEAIGMHMVPCGFMSFVLLLNSFVLVLQLGLYAVISLLAKVVYCDLLSAVLWWRNTPRLLSVLLSRNSLKNNHWFQGKILNLNK